MVAMSATKLDGTLYRDEIFADLAQRVSALKDKGITPGLATVLVGEDPGSQSYVKMKHRDCEKLGINSIRKDLPADITQEELEAVIDELNADDACTGYIVQLPLPKHLDENAILERIDPPRMPMACTRLTWASSCSTRRRPCRAPRTAACTFCAASALSLTAPRPWSSAAALPLAAPSA